jgi:hypothetical protein
MGAKKKRGKAAGKQHAQAKLAKKRGEKPVKKSR